MDDDKEFIPLDESAVERGMALIHNVGVELEGGWYERPDGFVCDGSVSLSSARHVGEVPLPPVTFDHIEEVMLGRYPDVVNQTCGCHVHISFNGGDRAYRAVMGMANTIENRLVAALRDWGQRREIVSHHSFWTRLDGENQYCRRGGSEEVRVEQARARDKGTERRRVLNFCWTLHGTVEIRVLPMFKKRSLAVEAVQTVVRVFAEFLGRVDLGTLVKEKGKRAREIERFESELFPILLEFRSKSSYVRIEMIPALDLWYGMLVESAKGLTIEKALAKALQSKRAALPMVPASLARKEVQEFCRRLAGYRLTLERIEGI